MTPEEIINEVKAGFDRGETDQQIADNVGKKMGKKVSRRNVEGTRRLMGWLQDNTPPQPNPSIDVEFLLREFDEAKPREHHEEVAFTERMALLLDVTYETIHRWLLKEERIQARPVVPTPEEKLARAKEMLDDGMSYTLVAKETGVGKMTLTRRFPGMGFTPSDTGNYVAARRLEQKLGLVA